MVKPTPALRALLDSVAERYADQQLTDHLRVGDKGNVTPALLRAARLVIDDGESLPRPLSAAVCRGGCEILRDRFPGGTIELRVPPFAAVQLGMGTGPIHTRGTPPNVVEMAPEVFIDVLLGRTSFADAQKSASGAHAHEVGGMFSLISPQPDA